MSEYVSKKALLEWLKIRKKEHSETSLTSMKADAFADVIEYMESGYFDIPENERLREPLKWFSEQMEQRLKANDHKGGWDRETFGYFCAKIHDTVHKLTSKRFIKNPDLNLITKEAIDLANYAMMIADNTRHTLEETQ